MPAFFQRTFGHNIFWAGFVGFLLGILLSVAVWAGNRIIQTQSEIPPTTSLTNFLATPFDLIVSSPTDGDAVDVATITVSGTTSTPTTVVISGGSAEQVVDNTGSFSTNYQLVEGENDLVVSAIDDNGNSAEQDLSVFYSSEGLQ
jgi:hypothetical protein